METELRHITNTSSVQNNNENYYNCKDTTNLQEKEENDFPIDYINETFIKNDNQSQTSALNNIANNNPKSNKLEESLYKSVIKSKNNKEFNKENLNKVNNNNKQINLEKNAFADLPKNFQQSEIEKNANLIDYNNDITENVYLNKDNLINDEKKEEIDLAKKPSYDDYKPNIDIFNVYDKSLKLKETKNVEEIDFDSLCNSKGNTNKSLELNENKDLNENLVNFDFDDDNLISMQNFDLEQKINLGKLPDKTDSAYENYKINKDCIIENADFNINKNEIINNQLENKNKFFAVKKDLRNKSNQKQELNSNDRRSSLAKNDFAMKDEHYKKNFLKNNLEKLSNKNHSKNIESNDKISKEEAKTIKNTNEIIKIKPNKDNILSPKNILNANKTDILNINKLPKIKLNKNSMFENINNNNKQVNITNIKAITVNDKNKQILKKQELEAFLGNPTKRAFSEKRPKRFLIADKDSEKEKMNLTKEDQENNFSANKNNENNLDPNDKMVRKILKNRTSEYLKTLNLKIKNKILANQEKQKKEENISKKLKENLGWLNVKPKLLEPKKEIEEEYPIKNKSSKNKSLNKLNKLKPNSNNNKKSNTPLTQETSDTLEYEEKEDYCADSNKDKDAKIALYAANNDNNSKFSNSSSHLSTIKKLSKNKIVKEGNISELANCEAINCDNNNDKNNDFNKHNPDDNDKNTENNLAEKDNKQAAEHHLNYNSNKNNQNKNTNSTLNNVNINNENNAKKRFRTKKEKDQSEPSKKPNAAELKEKLQQQLEKEKVIIQERILKLKNCYTIEDWKRRNRIAEDKNVFICFKGYPDMRKALLDRGWIENVDPSSNYYDFKYALSARNIDFSAMQKNQFVNHFEKNSELTRKVMLSKNLKNLVWFRNVDINCFFPRCFDLSDANDTESFAGDFKVTKAEAVLKKYLDDLEVVKLDKVKAAMNVVERKLKCLAEVLESEKFNFHLVSDKEWELIKNDESKEISKIKDDENSTKHRNPRSKEVKSLDTAEEEKIRSRSFDLKIKKSGQINEEKISIQNDCLYKEKVKCLLQRTKEKFPQTEINGVRNIWIIKPSGLSRGRGIKCADDLDEILNQVKSGANQFIIQKYIENPLIVNKRKFDIRQWVLVTNWNPLTIYVYDEPYIRFSAEDYDPENIQNLYSHLTNNAICKNSDLFECSEIKGNMWEINQFTEYLQKNFNADIFKEKIKPKIDEIIIWSLESVQDVVINRKNCHEIYGFDLMVDEQFNVWLIEINSSPCMEYSTDITKRLVKSVMEDTCKVIIDNIFCKNKNSNTGLWKRVYKGVKIDEVNIQPGFELMIEGNKFNPKDEIKFDDS